jgi:uncharacterized Zn-finger protein
MLILMMMTDDGNIPIASESYEVNGEQDTLLPDVEGPYSSSNSEDDDSLSGLFGDSYLESVMIERLQNLESSNADTTMPQEEEEEEEVEVNHYGEACNIQKPPIHHPRQPLLYMPMGVSF